MNTGEDLVASSPADSYADYWTSLAINRGELHDGDVEAVAGYWQSLCDRFAASGAPELAVNPDVYAGRYDDAGDRENGVAPMLPAQ